MPGFSHNERLCTCPIAAQVRAEKNKRNCVCIQFPTCLLSLTACMCVCVGGRVVEIQRFIKGRNTNRNSWKVSDSRDAVRVSRATRKIIMKSAIFSRMAATVTRTEWKIVIWERSSSVVRVRLCV